MIYLPNLDLFYFYVYACLPAYMYIMCVCGTSAHGGQKRASDSLQLELQMAASCLAGYRLQVQVRLTTEQFIQNPQKLNFYFNNVYACLSVWG